MSAKEVLLEDELESEPGYLRCFKRTFVFLIIVSFILMIASVVLLFAYYSHPTNVIKVQIYHPYDPICKPTDFDNFVFAVRWAPSVCISSICSNETQKWDIHGLWPNYKNGSWPQNCCKKWHFNIKNISTIVEQMEIEWPNLEPKKSYWSLWKHEWMKHGTCAYGRFQNEFDYFNATLELNKGLHVQEDLEAAGIKPTDKADNPMDVAKIHSALESKLNAKIHLECIHLKKQIAPFPLLIMISVCVDKTNLKPVDCPQHETDCGTKVIYPSINYPH